MQTQTEPQTEKPIKPLNDRQLKFCREYAADPNYDLGRAYMRAGYECKDHRNAGTAARILFARPEIKAEIQRIIDRTIVKTDIDAESVLRTLMEIANFDPLDLMRAAMQFGENMDFKILESLPLHVRRCITSFTWKAGTLSVKWTDRMQAIRLLAEHVGIVGIRDAQENDRVDEWLADQFRNLHERRRANKEEPLQVESQFRSVDENRE